MEDKNHIKKVQKMMKFLKATILLGHEYMNYDDCIQYVKSSVIYTPINMTPEEGEKKKTDFTHDILNNVDTPKIIGKYSIQNDIYSIILK